MRDRLIHRISLAVALLALAVNGTAQETVRRAESVRPGTGYDGSSLAPMATVTQRAVLIDPNKRLGVGDQVAIEIVEDREGPTTRLITATGDLEVPPLDRVHVAGKTTTEAAADIKRLLEADYYYHATVKLSIDRVNVAAALGKAEVVSFDSGYEVWVYRGKAPDRDPSRAMPERVILFSPAGDAVRDRLRLPPPVAGR